MSKGNTKLAAQILFRGFGPSEDALRLTRMVIPEEDRKFLVDPPASAFVFITETDDNKWIVRIASEYFVQDVEVKTLEPLKVLRSTLKILKDNVYETACIITDNHYLYETVNGGEGLDDDSWAPDRMKLNKQCVNQQVSASEPMEWQQRHIKQMQSAKTKTIRTREMEIFV